MCRPVRKGGKDRDSSHTLHIHGLVCTFHRRICRAPSTQTSFSERAVLRAGQVVQGDYFAVGPQVEISGIVNGDLYAAGGQVLIDGVVNGDVIVMGGKVTLSGIVAQDARIAGGQVFFSGTIGRNATVGEEISI